MFLANPEKINESDECACADESRLLSGTQAQESKEDSDDFKMAVNVREWAKLTAPFT